MDAPFENKKAPSVAGRRFDGIQMERRTKETSDPFPV
jgi:hypothetical protein